MDRIQFFKKVASQTDRTVKYIFRSPEIIEFSYINKNDGKDIICVPTQTSCRLGCKFCFLSDYKLPVRNLQPEEIIKPIEFLIDDMGLLEKPKRNRILLISFMGCGEPLMNLKNVIDSAVRIRENYKNDYGIVRFAIATLVPKPAWLFELTRLVEENDLLLKVHLSLHSPFNEIRKELMPAASNIEQSIFLLERYRKITGNSVEIHYAMIEGVNDRNVDLVKLITIFLGKNIPIKFLAYNEKPLLEMKESERVEYFREKLSEYGIETEFYIPPGRDIGSSCGQFLMEYYLEYNQTVKK
jgi:23S rRNA (adenine2503-C2)-methyltransferase